jgi:hypothetical protein
LAIITYKKSGGGARGDAKYPLQLYTHGHLSNHNFDKFRSVINYALGMPINFEANKKGSVCEWVIILSLVTFGIYFNHDIKTTPDNSSCTILRSARERESTEFCA